MSSITIQVNGAAATREVEPRMLLVHFLRDALGLTGTHVGCDTSQCGACTVLLDGQAVKSCSLFAVQVEGREIRRGILRDFPTDYKDRYGNSVKVPFEVLAVQRDGRPEPYAVTPFANGRRIRIGACRRPPLRIACPLYRQSAAQCL